MSWDVVTAISEFIGALAVVISLMYVAAQVKQSNRQAASDSSRALLSEFSRVDELILTTPEIVALMVKLRSEAELSAEEKILAEHFCLRHLNNWMVAESSHENGLLDDNLYADMIADAKRTFAAYPPVKRILRELLGNYPTIKEMDLLRAVFADD
jgi:hypothetical protein